jgi:hypothetical protein
MWRAGPIAVIVVVASSSPAAAQVNSDAAAEAAFQEGRELMAAGSFAAAAEKFAASDRAAPSVGARINLGNCYKSLGKTASAWTSYKAAVNLARKNDDHRRAQAATRLAAELEPKLVHVIVSGAAGSRAPGIEVVIAGTAVPAALWGQRFPIDPGDHRVVASAPERQSWEATVRADTPGEVITLEVPALEPASGPATEAASSDVKKPLPARTGADPGTTGAGDGRRLLAMGIGGTGVVAVGVGVTFGAGARSTWNEAFDSGLCDPDTNICDAEGQSLTDRARSRANIANVLVGAGVVLAGAGVVLYLTAPSDRAAPIAAAPWIEPGAAGVVARGQF